MFKKRERNFLKSKKNGIAGTRSILPNFVNNRKYRAAFNSQSSAWTNFINVFPDVIDFYLCPGHMTDPKLNVRKLFSPKNSTKETYE